MREAKFDIECTFCGRKGKKLLPPEPDEKHYCFECWRFNMVKDKVAKCLDCLKKRGNLEEYLKSIRNPGDASKGLSDVRCLDCDDFQFCVMTLWLMKEHQGGLKWLEGVLK